MNKRHAVQQLIDSLLPETIVSKFQTEDRLTENEDTTLGVAISVWTEWDALRIMRVFKEALEDANYHDTADEIEHWIYLLEKDDSAEYDAYFQHLESLR